MMICMLEHFRYTAPVRLIIATVIVVVALACGRRAHGLASDVNCDQSLSDADVMTLIEVLFSEDSVCGQEDVNADQVVSAADVVGVVTLLGAAIESPTPTRSFKPPMTPAFTSTVTGTVFPSATPKVSAT